MRVRVSAGELAGAEHGGVASFLGIPYAAAPVGEHRFAAPAPAPAWDGVRDATRFGPTAPQTPYPPALARLLPTVTIPGDEVLNLNVWAAADRDAAGRPVLVWFHGGSLTRGTAALPVYDGASFARQGIVVVSANYRLGAEGFSVLAGAPANLGLADQLAVLRWVRDEIGAFGGDPGRVTVMGESAGGTTTAALMVSPRAAGLFHRAIVQSGPLDAAPLGGAAKVTRRMARRLGVPATREAFARIPPEQLVTLQRAFRLAVDDDLVPRAVDAAVAESGMPLLTGTTTDEYRLWMVPDGSVHRIGRLHLLLARLKYRIPSSVMREYTAAGPGERFGELATDLLLRVPMTDAADARVGPTWVYEFAWPSPVLGIGAAHATELPFVFNTLGSSKGLVGPEAPQALADEMHAVWARFVHGEEPGWPRWDATRPVRRFDGAGNPVVRDPRGARRAVMSELLRGR
ncbi:carboxylesterase family protein [Dactylosporangium sp. AC04546]|uniref:carboxylesterase/lipase family protein n=1 Tax=Dactylosporangium sp. AC04546 TaxID=2862460 RepID=UPI001EDCF90B|nr:carboxylesterase family protein [Dactylosporangium sp. AC04546]WVK87985.1 carboxylesterase family protein [Dactylosporangium sp. AC04546]